MAETEEVEVVDQECNHENHRPPEAEDGPENQLRGGIFNVPDGRADGTPLPEKQKQGEACAEDVGGTFDRPRDDLGPAFLEPAAGHDAVLERKDREEAGVDGQGFGERVGEWAVKGVRDEEAAHEGDGVEDGEEESRVGDEAKGKT